MDLNFHPIEARDVRRLRPYFGMRSNYTCDSVVMDSYLWKDFFRVQCACIEGKAAYVISYAGGRWQAALPFCRKEDMPCYFRLLEEYFNRDLGQKLYIVLADMPGIRALGLSESLSEGSEPEDGYRITEDADAADYVYDAESLRTLAGRKYHKKKNHVNAFLAEYEGRYEYRRLAAADKETIWKFLERWRLQKGDEVGEQHLEAEIVGLHGILNHMEELDTCMAGIFVDGVLEAFTLGSYNQTDKMAVIHCEKANSEIRGLYPFINQQFLVHEFPQANLVNREDDLGLPGLRRAKESYHPIMKVKKYSMVQR